MFLILNNFVKRKFNLTDFRISETFDRAICSAASSLTLRTLRFVLRLHRESSKPPQRNIIHEEEEALKELKKDESIVILKADKGNATIITNATEYNNKINCLLSDSFVYSKLSKNQIRSLKSHPMSINMYRIFSKIKKLLKPNIIFCIVLKV